jgi:hypothetical protein
VAGILDSRRIAEVRRIVVVVVVGRVVDMEVEVNVVEALDSPVLEPQVGIRALGFRMWMEPDMEVGFDRVVVVQRTASSMVRSLSAINA